MLVLTRRCAARVVYVKAATCRIRIGPARDRFVRYRDSTSVTRVVFFTVDRAKREILAFFARVFGYSANNGGKTPSFSRGDLLAIFIRRSLFGRERINDDTATEVATFAMRNLLRNGIFLAHVHSCLISISIEVLCRKTKSSLTI